MKKGSMRSRLLLVKLRTNASVMLNHPRGRTKSTRARQRMSPHLKISGEVIFHDDGAKTPTMTKSWGVVVAKVSKNAKTDVPSLYLQASSAY